MATDLNKRLRSLEAERAILERAVSERYEGLIGRVLKRAEAAGYPATKAEVVAQLIARGLTGQEDRPNESAPKDYEGLIARSMARAERTGEPSSRAAVVERIAEINPAIRNYAS